MSRRRIASVAVLLVCSGLILSGPSYSAPSDEPEPEFTATKTMTRSHVEADGTESPAVTKTVTATVSQVTGLRSNQQIRVSWTGAQPTRATSSAPNSVQAPLQEYPVVVMQCRGVDTPAHPLDPSTCWTQGVGERRYTDPTVKFPPWRLDRYETAANRRGTVGLPPSPPASCDLASEVSPPARYVPFVGPPPQNITYYPLNRRENDSCGPVLATDMVNVEDKDSTPTNTTYAASNAKGDGSIKFVVTTDEQNQSLGCSTTVLCTLVVLPIMGVSCDLAAAALPAEDRPTGVDLKDGGSKCKANGRKGVGEIYDNNDPDQIDVAVTARFWWSASNWRNRITVPLTFVPSGNLCVLTDNDIPLDMFGSELMVQATDQWATAFCTDPTRFKFRHVRLGEPQAKAALVASGARAALVSSPPPEPYPIRTVSAPIAVTGFAISYTMDDATGNEYKDLKLNARLLAKLLSESYPTKGDLKAAYGKADKNDPYLAMADNPLAVTLDPEFKALNPTIGDGYATILSSSTLLALSVNSDVMYALSAYLNADPEARAFLNGAKDPWGMVVNPGYKGIQLPLPAWPLLDSFVSPNFTPYTGCSNTEYTDTLAQIPYPPLVASPVASLANVAQRVQYALANAHVNCSLLLDEKSTPVGVNMSAIGRQEFRGRFMLGVTSLADAEFLQLNTAALQSHSTASTTAQFTGRDGRTFVAPTGDSMAAAMRFVKQDTTANTWVMQYDKLVSADGASAYPGTLPVFATIPTENIGADGAKLAQFLKFAVGPGQTPGLGSGLLPPGYLPLTAANGLGDFAAFTLRAADAVAAQAGTIPLVQGGNDVKPPPPTTGGGTGNTGTGTATVPATGTRPSGAVPSASASAAPQAAQRTAGFTAGLSSALAAWALPVAVIITLATFLIGSVTRAVTFVVTWWKAT
ncbi:hypothetical protein ACFO1B_03395 [Dactylosporangium siamense]|uniref:PBP domain-containing protein n=1 Tax=Dactylosporangium siamense TaxID=685454 RepID=A0A919U8S6_9ACTN|nr:hypothetical protein [Dactylosporangium siamense]GIG43075.1 hypothetical protein Dsi01nite_011160 [Dactylosporangium siamense]